MLQKLNHATESLPNAFAKRSLTKVCCCTQVEDATEVQFVRSLTSRSSSCRPVSCFLLGWGAGNLPCIRLFVVVSERTGAPRRGHCLRPRPRNDTYAAPQFATRVFVSSMHTNVRCRLCEQRNGLWYRIKSSRTRGNEDNICAFHVISAS